MVFTQKAMLYLGLILDENPLDNHWCDCEENADLIVPTVAFSRVVHWVCCASTQPISQRFPDVWEKEICCFETAHLPATREISACSVSLLLSFSQRRKGRRCFLRSDWGVCALQRGAANVACRSDDLGRRGSLYPFPVGCVWSDFNG